MNASLNKLRPIIHRKPKQIDTTDKRLQKRPIALGVFKIAAYRSTKCVDPWPILGQPFTFLGQPLTDPNVGLWACMRAMD